MVSTSGILGAPVIRGGRDISNRLSLTLLLLLTPAAAKGWIYPEHRDITTEAISRLSPADRATLEALWRDARSGYAAKLCEPLSAGDQGLTPACIDFAAFPAFSGDHSCSPKEVLEVILPGDWILDVARVSAETKEALAGTSSRKQRKNAAATNDLNLEVVDPQYATRAGANHAHFLLPRTSDDLRAYVVASMSEGAPLNALGLHVQYHVAAMGLAQRLASGAIPPSERAAAARDIVALEGFALHWLEDIYASGHDVGTWGSDAWRKGTHDYYDEFGIDTVDWRGRTVVAFGDAHMSPADLQRASTAVADSLRQLAGALRAGDELGKLSEAWGPGPVAIRAFDSCKETGQPRPGGWNVAAPLAEQVERMPRPSMGPGQVHLPRYRDELGPFLGAYGALSGGVGWGPGPSAVFAGNLGAGFRIGYGADSLTGSIGTGILFLEAGIEADTSERAGCGGMAGCETAGTAALFPQVPARIGMSFGMRLPFWIIPGDMLLLGPVLALAAPSALNRVVVEAASGGLIPLERSFETGAGVFQIVAGREARAVLFGYVEDLMGVVPVGVLPDGTPQYGAVKFKSVQLQFPVLEWTPFRSFATQLTFAAQIQLGFSVGIPTSTQVMYPAGGAFTSSPGWSVWLRGVFDGRYFFGSREDLQSAE